jgi:hypothetical protein
MQILNYILLNIFIALINMNLHKSILILLLLYRNNNMNKKLVK